MLHKSDIIGKAYELKFGDVGVTNVEPFVAQNTILIDRKESYEWAVSDGLDLIRGTDPKKLWPEAKAIIVLIEEYFREAFPPFMEKHFGRCYLDDDRVMKDRLSSRIKDFRSYLRENGVDSKLSYALPHRITAARAGLGNFGKNCLLYSNKVALQGSWVLPIPVMVNYEFPPDKATFGTDCPDWCKNACLTACPTGALKKPRHIEPRRCISYLTYCGKGPTPRELREPMGLWVYGCDRCQNVCPRNSPWLAKELPINEKVAAMVADFQLTKLLHMDADYFNTKVFPHMFYVSEENLWNWKMNVARVIGNSLDDCYVPDLKRAFRENGDERVRAMVAWSLGRIGGPDAKQALEGYRKNSDGLVLEEIEWGLSRWQ
jgi:epoxyqueuosine reductase